jgi:predicted PurR-regulated permease PerM
MHTKTDKPLTIHISATSILLIFGAIIAYQFLHQILAIVFIVFTSILITLGLCPLIDKLEKKRINRAFSSLVILFGIFGLLIGSTISIATPLIEQTTSFIDKLPNIVSQVTGQTLDMSQISSQFNMVPSQFLRIAMGTASGLITVLSIVVMSFYMIQELGNLKSHLHFWFGKTKGEQYHQLVQKLEDQIGMWVRGQLLLMLIVGVLSYIGYSIIGLPYVLALAVIAGMLELVPSIGPTVAAVPAVLVGLSISPTHGIAALIVAVVVQQLENNLIVPKIMQQVTGLSPVTTIIVLMTGFSLGGPLLAVLSLPMVLSARVLISHFHWSQETAEDKKDSLA